MMLKCMQTQSLVHLLNLPKGHMSKVSHRRNSYNMILLFSLLQQHPAARPTPILSFLERQPEGTILEGAE